jgi:hypothetical protein
MSVAAVTVSVVDPETVVAGIAAVIVVIPWVRAVARPSLPMAADMVATVLSEDVQVTWVVRSCVDLSE